MGAAEKIEIESEVIAVANLVPFPRNPRSVSEHDPKVVELAAHMKANGQQEPIVVRTTDDGESWETLTGNRRRVAARLAGLEELRAEVRRDLDDDDDALRFCLSSQIQHEDLAPLEEADALFDLMFAMGPRTSTAELASAIGKSEKHVRDRLALRGLVAQIRPLAPRVDLGALHALASLSDVAQKRIAERLAKVLENKDRVSRSIVSRIIEQENVTRSLRTVPWKLDDAELTEAGACNVCPKRTGQGALLDDVVAADDVCLDDSCYADKGAAQWEQAAAEQRKLGAKVLSSKESARVLDHGRPKHDSAYVSAEEKLPLGDKYMKTANLLAAAGVLPTIAQDPETKAPVELYQRKDVDAAVKKAKAEHASKVAKKASKPAKPAPINPKRQAAEERERERERTEDLTTEMILGGAVTSLTAGDLHPAVALMRMCMEQIHYDRDGEVLAVAHRRGIVKSRAFTEARAASKGLEDLARKLAKAKDAAAMLGLYYELFVGSRLNVDDKALKAELGIDRPAVRKEAAKRLALPMPPKGKGR